MVNLLLFQSSAWSEEESAIQFGGKKSAIEIDSSIWREEIGTSGNRCIHAGTSN
jgi:hypothetical protein